MRLLTYNIHGCVGRGGKFDPAAVVDVIREANADLVALQEVTDGPAESDEFFAGLLDLYPADGIVRGPTMQKNGADYGNLLLSRLEIERVERLDITFDHREPRGAIRVWVTWEDQCLEVTATHLGLAPDERRFQINRLLAEPDEGGHRSPVQSRVLMGDLNEWWPFSRANWLMREHYGPSASPRTFPARLPLFPLDRIHLKSETLIARSQVLVHGLARKASDHLPLSAELTRSPEVIASDGAKE